MVNVPRCSPHLPFAYITHSRTEVLYAAMVSGYSHEHLKAVIPRTDQAIKLARSAGDRIYEGFSQCYSLAHRLYCSEHCELLSATAFMLLISFQ